MSEKFTYNQVNEQESSAYINRRDDQPTVLVKRTDGRVTVGRLDKATNNVSFSENGQKWWKEVPLRTLADQGQMDLAQELAGKPLRDDEAQNGPEEQPRVNHDIGVRAVQQAAERPQQSRQEQLQSQLDIIGAKYDQEGSLNLWRYASGVMNKRDAQQAGDGQESMNAHQQSGLAMRELEKIGGAAARKDAETYLRLMQQLQAERNA